MSHDWINLHIVKHKRARQFSNYASSYDFVFKSKGTEASNLSLSVPNLDQKLVEKAHVRAALQPRL